jgi:hypothetical protein
VILDFEAPDASAAASEMRGAIGKRQAADHEGGDDDAILQQSGADIGPGADD